MRNFLLNSILILMLSCRGSQTNHLGSSQLMPDVKKVYNFPFSSDSTAYLYKTSADIYGHYLTGLLLIKATSYDNYRIVFTNELGVKFFDVELVNHEFKVNFVMDKLDRKPVLRILENDFRHLLAFGLSRNLINKLEKANGVSLQYISGKEMVIYQIDKNPFRLLSCETFSKSNRKKSSIIYSIPDTGVPDTVKIAHYNIKLEIELNFINR